MEESTYDRIETLNRTIDRNLYREEAAEYIVNHYMKQGIRPTLAFLIKERQRLERHLYKDNEFLSKLITANRYLGYISMDVFLEDYELEED